MMTRTLAIAAAVLASHGCKGVECGEGTLEKNGTCVGADDTVGNAKCGTFTHLDGDKCVPDLSPTTCDTSTTAPNVDPSTGVTTCVGTGATSCASALACPPPSAGKQTICGQIYDLENGMPFSEPGATGKQCTSVS